MVIHKPLIKGFMKTYFEVDKDTLFEAYGDPHGSGDPRFGYLMEQDGYGDFLLASKYYLIIDEENI